MEKMLLSLATKNKCLFYSNVYVFDLNKQIIVISRYENVRNTF